MERTEGTTGWKISTGAHPRRADVLCPCASCRAHTPHPHRCAYPDQHPRPHPVAHGDATAHYTLGCLPNGDEVVALAQEGIRLWAATHRGAVCWGVRRRTYRKHTTLDGLASNNPQAVAVDEEGNRWFGTCKAEVTRLSPGNVHRTVYSLNEGLAGGRVQAIAMDSQGNAWFGTNGGVSVLTREGVRTNTSHG